MHDPMISALPHFRRSARDKKPMKLTRKVRVAPVTPQIVINPDESRSIAPGEIDDNSSISYGRDVEISYEEAELEPAPARRVVSRFSLRRIWRGMPLRRGVSGATRQSPREHDPVDWTTLQERRDTLRDDQQPARRFFWQKRKTSIPQTVIKAANQSKSYLLSESQIIDGGSLYSEVRGILETDLPAATEDIGFGGETMVRRPYDSGPRLRRSASVVMQETHGAITTLNRAAKHVSESSTVPPRRGIARLSSSQYLFAHTQQLLRDLESYDWYWPGVNNLSTIISETGLEFWEAEELRNAIAHMNAKAAAAGDDFGRSMLLESDDDGIATRLDETIIDGDGSGWGNETLGRLDWIEFDNEILVDIDTELRPTPMVFPKTVAIDSEEPMKALISARPVSHRLISIEGFDETSDKPNIPVTTMHHAISLPLVDRFMDEEF